MRLGSFARLVQRRKDLLTGFKARVCRFPALDLCQRVIRDAGPRGQRSDLRPVHRLEARKKGVYVFHALKLTDYGYTNQACFALLGNLFL